MRTSPGTAGRLTARDAAAYMEVSPNRFYEWLNSGELDEVTHVLPGSDRRYWFADELDAWLRSRCFAPASRDEASA